MPDEKLTVEAIFNAARKIADPGPRADYLRQACGGAAGVLARVQALLHAHEAQSSFLQPAAPPPGLLNGAGEAVAATFDFTLAERPGTAIGPYKLLEQIGEGGMGVVFMAEQTGPVRRKVALKILKPGMNSRQVVARFEAERQALAIMDHPHIARVFDGGATASGRPYFVMELVRGVPIIEFCDRNRLTPRQRLELFIPVCQAVQHAHQKGIIHRDLKPSNILVSRHDITPIAKVIDFGVAKALGQELTDKTLFTGFAQMVGTPLYMSPEQAGMSDLDVDTRSDIYSLGVLLYELLTGATPFDLDRLRTVSFDEMRRIIREEEPPRPSARLTTMGAALSTASEQRGTDPRRLTQLLNGELDWIVLKALEKDRNRRYESASAFATDIQRYLNDMPVQACPPSMIYQLRKFWRRNRAALSVSAAGLLGVLLMTALLAVSNVLIRREKAAASQALAAETKAKEDLQESVLRERRNYYAYAFRLAQRDWLAGDIGQARRGLDDCPEEHRDRDWRYLHRVCHAEVLRIDQWARQLQFSPDGNFLAGVVTGAILWDATSGAIRADFRPLQFGSRVTTIAFSPTGTELTCATSGEPLLHFYPVGKDVEPPGFDVTVLDLSSRTLSARFGREASGKAALSRDGARVLLIAAQRSVLRSGVIRPTSATVCDARAGKELCTLALPTERPLVQALFHPDGSILTISTGEKKLRLWDGTSGKPTREIALGDQAFNVFALSPGGQWLAAANSIQADPVKVWHLPSFREIATLRGPETLVNCLAFSPDGGRLATGGSDNTVIVWDVEKGRELLTLRGHKQKVTDLAFSPDGNRLASSSTDATVRIWEVSPLAEVTGPSGKPEK